MNRSLVGHAVLAIVTTLAAYVAWAKPGLGSHGEDASVVMIPGRAKQLHEVDWHEPDYDVDVVRKNAAGSDDPQTVVTVKRHIQEKALEGAPPGVRNSTKVYPGNKGALELFDEMAPLEAARSLGKPDAKHLASMGLDHPRSKLTLHFGDRKVVVKLGDTTYGSGDAYALAPDGEVYLVRSTSLGSLRRGGTVLLDQRALGIDPTKIAKVRISTPKDSREVVHRFAEEPDKAFYADPAVPGHKLTKLTGWIDRVLKLRISDVTTTQPTSSPDLTVEVFSDKGSLGKLQLWQPHKEHAIATSTLYPESVLISRGNADVVLQEVKSIMHEGRN